MTWGGKRPVQASLIAFVACCFISTSVIAQEAVDDGGQERAVFALDIERQPVKQSLQELSRQTETPLLFPLDETGRVQANELIGEFTLEDALAELLRGTGLRGEVIAGRAMTIVRDPQLAPDHGENENVNRGFRRFLLATASGLWAGVSAAPAIAQEEGQGASQGVDIITVTATKREETLQEVPVSVAAVSAEAIEARGAMDLADLSVYVPNFEYSDASILPNLYIRGIGSGTTHSIEQSVGRFVDEVYIGRAAINLHPLLDVSNVEVLRGPQGTLFGKNTLGGAVIIRTGDPTQELMGDVTASYSDFSTTGDQKNIEGFVSGPISDNLSFRVAGMYRDREGYIENLLPGPDGGTREDWGLRGKLLFEGDTTTVNLKVEHLEYTEDGQTPSVNVSSNGSTSDDAAGAFRAAVPSFNFVTDEWVSYIDCTATLGQNETTFCPDRVQETNNITLRVDQEVGDAGTLTYVSGYQNYDYTHNFVAIDQGIVGGSLRATRIEDYNGFTQEVRFTSTEFDKFDYIAGAYYENSQLERLQPSDFDVPEFVGAPIPECFNSAECGGPPFFTDREDWVQDTETVALFGQFRYHLTDALTAIIGGRYSYESKDFVFELATVEYEGEVNLATDEIFDESRTESRFTPSVTLRWEAADNLNLYGTFSQGHKTGGFSDRVQDPLEFDAELATSYELGGKGVFLDGSLAANVALFYIDIQDLQVARALPGFATSFEVRNAAEATTMGVEFDAQWALNDIFTLGGNFAYTDAEYDDFPGAATGCPIAGGTLDAGSGLCNYAGIPLIYAPTYKGAVYLQYDMPELIGGWGVSGLTSFNFSDEFYPEINYIETLKQPAYETIDTSISFNSPNDKFSIGFVGRNLTEEFVIAWGLQAGFTEYVAPNPPREFQVRTTFRF